MYITECSARRNRIRMMMMMMMMNKHSSTKPLDVSSSSDIRCLPRIQGFFCFYHPHKFRAVSKKVITNLVWDPHLLHFSDTLLVM